MEPRFVLSFHLLVSNVLIILRYYVLSGKIYFCNTFDLSILVTL